MCINFRFMCVALAAVMWFAVGIGLVEDEIAPIGDHEMTATGLPAEVEGTPEMEMPETRPSASKPVIIGPFEPIETEPIETEPVYGPIDIPDVSELPAVEALRTVYDVEDAIIVASSLVEECSVIMAELPLEHPQYSEITECEAQLQERIAEYTSVLDRHWASREAKRPVMTHVWWTLRANGWSDEVVAGIVGNMIAECGGMGYQDLDWDVYGYDKKGNAYYGVCQWALIYAPELSGKVSLDKQLEYLTGSIKREMNTVYSRTNRAKFGMLNMRYDSFLELDSAYDAAIAFAVCYERCDSRVVECRGPLAEKAFEYFTVLDSWPWPGD